MSDGRKGSFHISEKSVATHTTLIDGGKDFVKMLDRSDEVSKYQIGRITPIVKGRAQPGIIVKPDEGNNSFFVTLKRNTSVQEFRVYAKDTNAAKAVIALMQRFATDKHLTYTQRG